MKNFFEDFKRKVDLEDMIKKAKDFMNELQSNVGETKTDEFVDADFEFTSPKENENLDFSNLSDEEIIEKLPKFIDHTILNADATKDDIKKVIEEAKEYGFYSVCVNSWATSMVNEGLKDSDVKVCSVVGFPLGAMSVEAKAYEAKKAVEDGADEIDMVLNVGALKSKDYNTVLKDISEVVKKSYPAKVKVILETCLLNEEEKIVACTLSKTAGAHYVKTSTGFSTGGASVQDISLMRKLVGSYTGVKASGGVRDQKTAIEMIKAGASRVGASSSIKIIKG